jgi:hypothetical protein
MINREGKSHLATLYTALFSNDTDDQRSAKMIVGTKDLGRGSGD